MNYSFSRDDIPVVSGDTENVATANSNVKVSSLIFKVNQRI